MNSAMLSQKVNVHLGIVTISGAHPACRLNII